MKSTDRVMNGWQLVCFSCLSAPLAMVGFAVVSFVPTFYAIDMGLGLAVVGGVFMFGRFFDVFTDPLIGALSDRTGGARGPRLPWMLFSFPSVLLFAWLLLSPSDNVGPIYLFCVLSGYLLSVTAFDVPYSSIGLEISPYPHERSVLAGTKAVFQILGALAASLAPVIIGTQMGLSLSSLVLIFLASMPLAMAAFLIWTPRHANSSDQAHPGVLNSWRACLRKNTFRKLMIAFFLVQAANAMTVGLLVLFVTHVLQTPELVGQMFLMLLLATAFFVPLWVLLSKKVGKRRTWTIAIVFGAVLLAASYTVGAEETLLMQVICIGLGGCMTCDAVMPTSILADIVAQDEADSGHPWAASYLALKNAGSKMAFVAPMGVAFPVLGWAGFDKSATGSPEALSLLVFFFAGLPCLLRLSVSLFLWRKVEDFTEAAPAT